MSIPESKTTPSGNAPRGPRVYALADGVPVEPTLPYLRRGGRVIASPTLYDYAAAGYYPMAVEPPPKIDPASESLAVEYLLEDGRIKKRYRVIEP